LLPRVLLISGAAKWKAAENDAVSVATRDFVSQVLVLCDEPNAIHHMQLSSFILFAFILSVIPLPLSFRLCALIVASHSAEQQSNDFRRDQIKVQLLMLNSFRPLRFLFLL
jgi:hypothetical protein